MPGRPWDAAPAAGRKKAALAPRPTLPSQLTFKFATHGPGRRSAGTGSAAATGQAPLPTPLQWPAAGHWHARVCYGCQLQVEITRPGKGGPPGGSGGGPGPSAPSWGLLQMGLYRDDLGIWVLDPESPRHATRSSVARGPSSQHEGTVTVTANSEGGAGPAASDGTQAVRGSNFEVLALNPHAA